MNPLLKQMRDAQGKPRVCNHVWISYFTGADEDHSGEGFGKLTAGRSHGIPGGQL